MELLDLAFEMSQCLAKGRSFPKNAVCFLHHMCEALSCSAAHLITVRNRLITEAIAVDPHIITDENYCMFSSRALLGQDLEPGEILSSLETLIRPLESEGSTLTGLDTQSDIPAVLAPVLSDSYAVIAPIPCMIHFCGMMILEFSEVRELSATEESFITHAAKLFRTSYVSHASAYTQEHTEQQLRQLLQETPLCYQSLGEDGTFLEVNDKWLKTLGYAPEEVIGRNFRDFLSGQGKRDFKKNFAFFKAQGEIHDAVFDMLAKDGSTVTVSFNGRIRTDDEGKFKQTFCVYKDITKEQQLKEQLRESEHKYRAMFNSSNSVMLLIDPVSADIIDANHVAVAFYGYSYEQLTSMKITEINLLSSEEIEKRIQEAKIFKSNVFQFPHRCSDGTVKQVEAYSSPITIEGKEVLFSIINDITQRLEMEETLRQTQKLDAIGQLAGGIAHDFNNQLAAIMGYTELVGLLNHDKSTTEFLEKIITSCNRSKELIAQLLSFSRKSHTRFTKVSLHTMIKEMLELLKHTIDKNIIIEAALQAEQVVIEADENQLHTALLNLAINSRDAMKDGGRLTFRTRVVELSELMLREMNLPADHRRYIELTVTDTGEGIEPEHLNHIFEPFFTTKPKGKGTGMGLSAVWGTIQRHHGNIAVSSTRDTGTKFTILLPLTDSSQELSPKVKDTPIQQLPASSLRIMIVEDELPILESMEMYLKSLGYDVTAFSDGYDALEQIQISCSPDLVIMDMIMPNIGGKELFEKITSMTEDVRFIISSGFSLPSDMEAILSSSHARVLYKPYSMKDLLREIEALSSQPL